MKKVILNVEGMTCSACSLGLEKFLNKQKGIIEARVNLVLANVSIKYQDDLTLDVVENYIKQAGFKSLGKSDFEKGNKNKKLLIIFTVLEIILMYVSMGGMIGLPIFDFLNMTKNPVYYTSFILLLTILFLIYGFDIIKNGFLNLYHKNPNMDTLVGVGVIVNFLYSLYAVMLVYKGNVHAVHSFYFESSATIIYFVKLGRFLENKNKSKASDSIKNLVNITPKRSFIKRNGEIIEVSIDEIKVNDIVVCKSGDRVSVDGVVVKGSAYLDETFLTGESIPLKKEVDSTVLAGSYNYNGYIEYKALSVGKNSSISKIVDLVVEATNSKPNISLFADKISGYFVPFIFIVAVISFIIHLLIGNSFNIAINSLVSVLVVACPCALGLATPLAILLGVFCCSKRGILIKNGNAIEFSNNIKTVVFDKTGTLTKAEIKLIAGIYTKNDLEILQNMEEKSNHPLAKAVTSFSKYKKIKVTNFKEEAGFGIKVSLDKITYYAGGVNYLNKFGLKNPFRENAIYKENKNNSLIFLFTKDEVKAVFFLADEIRNDAVSVLKKLKQLNKEVVMLTGDNEKIATLVAKKLGIKEVISDVLPKDKLKYVKEKNIDSSVMMVGDGINDSPALKEALVSISVFKGCDISADSSDVVLMKDDLNLIIDLFLISKKTFRIIKENLFWALFYNICMIPLATGFFSISLNPMIASLAMTFSSITVVLNSLRLLKIKFN